jgi:hypothetical protein
MFLFSRNSGWNRTSILPANNCSTYKKIINTPRQVKVSAKAVQIRQRTFPAKRNKEFCKRGVAL